MTVMLDRPTAIDSPEEPEPNPALQPSFDSLFWTLLTMEVPEGFRAEIVGGNIVMSPWSKGYYLDVMDSLVEQLMPRLPKDQRVSYAPFLFALPGQERAYGPDIYVAAREAFRTYDRYIDGETLTLVAELTSNATRDVDWNDKLPVYAKAGIPVYLLLDMQDRSISVFSDPTPEGYAERTTCRFGKPVQLPSPFDFELDTVPFDAAPGKKATEPEAPEKEA
ncbi:Uma2 family endonuclease [Streptomyces sp. CA-250714]|uniref:Uma2 family endonuclease n=1 Tax=Streptomyces sp. CA-250714 TaxID=3240060 RepID=UPI003D94D07C